MIDLGISKMALIGVVALIVVGPEKLPRVARMAGTLFGRAQRYINDVKREVSREMELDDFRKMQQDIKEAASSVEQTISQHVSEARDAVESGWNDGTDSGSAGSSYSSISPSSAPNPETLAVKAKSFRKKRLAHSSAVPSWYKQQQGRRSRVQSGAARVARHRPAGGRKTSQFFL
ncbi:Sec-independent protein translocase protein TatB [Noviherbaspirillum pedocola]|uniref:Sec-independent protein translocase protein TatB n=1 Tax=Noviherbaspirillum pedocola TaxID=2801341 RepID=A0A934W5D8_9BURK|nr:Sec-independent protein translocase protein TatB [Noviherbaspirillum pedocola]MBK4733780.1 Sec-independent protein translocase subunit TatB [Noviherbaspirillum pedocola]